ncbi:MAG: alpha/beta fold hydrolase, partial [candidate division Zixibacteria bacterium]|nr:alpha/beta fold hydrolase [candidate division Zixibacteria bacterium]
DYPVMYFLHGWGNNHNGYTEIYSTLDDLIGAGDIEPFICVKPDAYCNPYRGTFFVNSELYGDYEDYIVYDLIEFVDFNYRTIPERDMRYLFGHSMGGYGSMILALKHPDIFRATVSHSGLLDVNLTLVQFRAEILMENGGSPPYDYNPYAGIHTEVTFCMSGAFSPNLDNSPEQVDFPLSSGGYIIDTVMSRWALHEPSLFAGDLPPDNDLAIYFDCSVNDTYLYPTNLAFMDSLDELEIDYQFHAFTGPHYVPERLYVSFVFFDSVMHSTTGVNDDNINIPNTTILSQNYPNPFNSSTTIEYTLNESSNVKLEIYDILGRKIETLLDEQQAAGHRKINWNASQYSSGIYFYKLSNGDNSVSKRMVLLK